MTLATELDEVERVTLVAAFAVDFNAPWWNASAGLQRALARRGHALIMLGDPLEAGASRQWLEWMDELQQAGAIVMAGLPLWDEAGQLLAEPFADLVDAFGRVDVLFSPVPVHAPDGLRLKAPLHSVRLELREDGGETHLDLLGKMGCGRAWRLSLAGSGRSETMDRIALALEQHCRGVAV